MKKLRQDEHNHARNMFLRNNIMYVETANELSRREILVLKEIRLTGRTTDCAIVRQLFDIEMIADFQSDNLQLTAKGRRMLLRGSPSLWDVAL